MQAAQAAIPYFKQGGRIITTGSSMAERVPFPDLTVYALSKSTLLAFTRSLAREIGPLILTKEAAALSEEGDRFDGELHTVEQSMRCT